MCEVDTHRAQLTIKFVNVSLAVVDLMVAASDETTAHSITAKVVSKVLPVAAQLAAWDRLVTQLDSHALVIDNGWSFHLEDLKGAVKNFSDVQSFIHSGWKRRGQKLLDSLEKVRPDKVLVTSKLLLTSESHQKSLRSAIANVVAGKFLMLASEALVAWKKFRRRWRTAAKFEAGAEGLDEGTPILQDCHQRRLGDRTDPGLPADKLRRHGDTREKCPCEVQEQRREPGR